MICYPLNLRTFKLFPQSPGIFPVNPPVISPVTKRCWWTQIHIKSRQTNPFSKGFVWRLEWNYYLKRLAHCCIPNPTVYMIKEISIFIGFLHMSQTSIKYPSWLKLMIPGYRMNLSHSCLFTVLRAYIISSFVQLHQNIYVLIKILVLIPLVCSYPVFI